METPPGETAVPFPDLTNREQEILTLIAHGKNNHEIAEKLHISVKTVSNHISKLNARIDWMETAV